MDKSFASLADILTTSFVSYGATLCIAEISPLSISAGLCAMDPALRQHVREAIASSPEVMNKLLTSLQTQQRSLEQFLRVEISTHRATLLHDLSSVGQLDGILADIDRRISGDVASSLSRIQTSLQDVFQDMSAKYMQLKNLLSTSDLMRRTLRFLALSTRLQSSFSPELLESRDEHLVECVACSRVVAEMENVLQDSSELAGIDMVDRLVPMVTTLRKMCLYRADDVLSSSPSSGGAPRPNETAVTNAILVLATLGKLPRFVRDKMESWKRDVLQLLVSASQHAQAEPVLPSTLLGSRFALARQVELVLSRKRDPVTRVALKDVLIDAGMGREEVFCLSCSLWPFFVAAVESGRFVLRSPSFLCMLIADIGRMHQELVADLLAPPAAATGAAAGVLQPAPTMSLSLAKMEEAYIQHLMSSVSTLEGLFRELSNLSLVAGNLSPAFQSKVSGSLATVFSSKLTVVTAAGSSWQQQALIVEDVRAVATLAKSLTDMHAFVDRVSAMAGLQSQFKEPILSVSRSSERSMLLPVFNGIYRAVGGTLPSAPRTEQRAASLFHNLQILFGSVLSKSAVFQDLARQCVSGCLRRYVRHLACRFSRPSEERSVMSDQAVAVAAEMPRIQIALSQIFPTERGGVDVELRAFRTLLFTPPNAKDDGSVKKLVRNSVCVMIEEGREELKRAVFAGAPEGADVAERNFVEWAEGAALAVTVPEDDEVSNYFAGLLAQEEERRSKPATI